MRAQLKCSNCGAEISSLNITWGKKEWLWQAPFFLLIVFMLFGMDIIMKDRNDFRKDLSISEIQKSYEKETVTITGVVRNSGNVNWESIVVEAEFFNADSGFVDEHASRLSVDILPNEAEHFKICADGFPVSKWDMVKDIKIKVADAEHYRF